MADRADATAMSLAERVRVLREQAAELRKLAEVTERSGLRDVPTAASMGQVTPGHNREVSAAHVVRDLLPRLKVALAPADLARLEQCAAMDPSLPYALRVALGKKRGKKTAPELAALYAAGLTPASAAALLGTTRDVLKQAWARGRQFRAIRPQWAARLAERGVPATVWRKEQ